MIHVNKLKKNYNSFALDCSFHVPKGYITGFIGQNGAGKSTTFKAILGLITKDYGEIEILGKDEIHFDRQQIGVVLSDSSFSGYLTITDIVPILEAMYDAFEKDKFMHYLQHFNLPLNKQLKEFSTGMKAKFKVIVAITHQAQLLVLDEPTSGLDVIARDEILSLLQEYMSEDENRSILISSHISSDLETLCDDLYMIDNGEIILHETIDQLLNEYAILKVTPDQFKTLDSKYILKVSKESFGYKALTNEKNYYMENYPENIIEKCSIDECISLMIKGGSYEGFIH